MKKYLVSLTIKEIEAVNEAEAVNEFEKLILSKELGLEYYTVREQVESEAEKLPIIDVAE
jgi:hypothetical protein